MIRLFTIISVLIFALLTNCGQSKMSNNAPASFISVSLPERADTLIQLSQKILHAKDAKLKENYQKLFFQFFPNSFALIDSLYGYDEKTGPSLLYNEGVNHIIKTFFKLDNISAVVFANRVIEISIDGTWEADAINYFQFGLRNNTRADTELYCRLLSGYSDDEIYSFWHFYFDGPHPENVKSDYESLHSEVRELNPAISKLMESAYKKLVSGRSH